MDADPLRAGVTRQTESVRFWHLGPFDDHPGLRQMELYFVMVLLKIVSTFVGPRWQPPVIGLQSSSMSRRANEIFPNTRWQESFRRNSRPRFGYCSSRTSPMGT